MSLLRHNAALMAALILCMSALALAGCMHDRPAAVAPQITPSALDARPMCGQVKVYSEAERTALADALNALDQSSPIVTAMGDYKRMRDEAQACQKAAGPK